MSVRRYTLGEAAAHAEASEYVEGYVLERDHDAAVAGLNERHAATERAACAQAEALGARISQLEAALELHEQRDREQSMCVLYTHEQDEARDKRIAQLEQSPEIIAQLEDEKRVMGERITALEAGIRKWASECAECGGKGFEPGLTQFHDCEACADIRALLPNILPNLPASGEG